VLERVGAYPGSNKACSVAVQWADEERKALKAGKQ
jgi:hypothetical protein